MKKNTKKIIVDLVNKIKYELSEEQMAKLFGRGTPLSEAEFVDWISKIDSLDFLGERSKKNDVELSKKLSWMLHRVVAIASSVGGKVPNVGKWIIRRASDLSGHFPRTSRVAVVIAVLALISAIIPYLHYVLFPLVCATGVCFIGYTFFYEVIAKTNISKDDSK